MAGGGFVDGRPTRPYEGKDTAFVMVTCIVAAMGGLIFGYDLGISGGVTSMDVFLEKFFPAVYRKEHRAAEGAENMCCRFDSQLLTLFTSSLYLAALASSFFASEITRSFGRKVSMFIGGVVFLLGAIINGFAVNMTMLIVGRILLGIGVGFANQSVPVYLSEMAPAKIRGALNMGFQIDITIGILVANLVNYGTNKIKGGFGWRLSLGLAAVPALLMTVGSMVLPDTPNSILERGKLEEAKKMLIKVRGVDNVDEELQDLIEACEGAKRVENPWKNITMSQYRPQLTFCVFIPFFQQMTGINIIMFYAPVLFKTLGFGDDASLMSSVITGVVKVCATFVSVFTVDRVGRRWLFLEVGIQMILCMCGAAALMAVKYGVTEQGSTSKAEGDVFLFLICAFVAGYAWSWFPLGWLVPTEVCSLDVRSAGQAINVSVNMIFTFIIAQAFLTMLCHMKFGLYFFFVGFIAIMTVFIHLLLPETKGVPIEDMNIVWKSHWLWCNYIPDHHLPPHSRTAPGTGPISSYSDRPV